MKRLVVFVEEDLSPRCHNYHRSRRHSLHLHDALNLLFLIFSCKNWESNIELVENAAERPHVDGGRVPDPHHDLWRSVKSTLDVSVKLISFIGSTAEINDLNSTFVRFPEQNVLWLHIAVNNIVLLHEVQRHQQLDGEPPDEAGGYALKVIALDEFVQVHAQHFEGENQVLPEQKFFLNPNNIFLVFRVVIPQLLKYFCFDQPLLVQSLLVSQYF